MEELKFTHVRDEEMPATPQLPNVFSGQYRYATQDTVVYDSYAFIRCDGFFMKLQVECQRAFVNGDKIGIVQGDKLIVYENLERILTLSIGENSEILEALFPNDQLKKYMHKEKAGGAKEFLVGERTLEVTPEEIVFGGVRIANTLHAEDARYFVAHKDGVTVLGNDKSFEFMYFLNGVHLEPEECFAISLRIDEEFEPVDAFDIKFFKNMLVLKDTEKNTYYELEGLGDDCVNEFKEAKIVADRIVIGERIDAVQTDLRRDEEKGSELGVFVHTEETLGPKAEKTEAPSRSVPDSISDIPEPVTKNENAADPVRQAGNAADKLTPPSFIKTDGSITDKPRHSVFDVSDGDAKSVAASLPKTPSFLAFDAGARFSDILKKEPSYGGNGIIASKPLQKTNSDVLAEFSSPFSTLETATAGSTKPKLNLPGIKKDGSDKLSESERRDAEVVYNKIQQEIRRLEQKISVSMQTSYFPIPEIRAIQPVLEWEKIYNLLYKNSLKEYNKVLTSMTHTLELKTGLSRENVEETIKYFDNKIIEASHIARPVSYASPLIPRQVRCELSAGDSVRSLIEGIKVICVKRPGKKEQTKGNAEMLIDESGKEEPKNASQSTLKKDDSNFTAPANSGSNVKSIFQNTQRLGDVIGSSKDNASILNCPVNSGDNAGSLSQQIRETPAVPSNPSLMPGPVNSAPPAALCNNMPDTPQRAIFGNGQISNPMHVSNTTTLFNSISNVGMPAYNAAPPSSQSTDDGQGKSYGGGSAFSRFAGSRSMFR